ncbi:hypothetical protein [Streptomyces sp. NPDC058424]|uniref:hypothetical protein n=1 Tax=Streptomyces sp. NPDC058424 TaxID=3346491 RepID=UPI0036513E7E
MPEARRAEPLAVLLPHRTCYVRSPAKVLALGLLLGVRVGGAVVHPSPPPAAPPSGARNAMAAEVLGGLGIRADAAAPHLWLPLPEPWGVGQFTAAARDADVLVSPGDEYATGRQQTAFGEPRDRLPSGERTALLDSAMVPAAAGLPQGYSWSSGPDDERAVRRAMRR